MGASPQGADKHACMTNAHASVCVCVVVSLHAHLLLHRVAMAWRGLRHCEAELVRSRRNALKRNHTQTSQTAPTAHGILLRVHGERTKMAWGRHLRRLST